jgi:hypothetical protein
MKSNKPKSFGRIWGEIFLGYMVMYGLGILSCWVWMR